MAGAVSLALLAGCSSDDDNDVGSTPTRVDADLAVARNDGTNPTLSLYRGGLNDSPTLLDTSANEGIAFDPRGTVYQNADSDTVQGIRALGMAGQRMDMATFDTMRDRMIGNSPGKGLVYVAAGNLLVSADVTDDSADLKAYAATAGENATPLFTIDMPATVWDMFYDESSDRLYAAMTNGMLGIFDQFSVEPGAGPDRTVVPVDADGTQVSVNFHGVFAADGIVLVSDVGDAGSATDGALFTFIDDGSLDGDTLNYTRIAGAATMLGNPVDVVLSDGIAVVAEKSNDAILTFANVATLDGDVMPDETLAFTKPESIAPIVDTPDALRDANDAESVADVMAIAVTGNPTPQQDPGDGSVDNGDVGRVSLLSMALGEMTRFTAGGAEGAPGSQAFLTLENLQVDSHGNAYAVHDTTDGTAVSARGLMAIHDIADRDGDSFAPTRDRFIGGTDSGLVSPKGIELVESRDAIIVADLGNDTTAPALHVFSMAAGSGAMPLFSVTTTGAAAIWDIDYDSDNDRLYAAGTAGDILVFDDFFAMSGNAAPTRSIQPSTAGATSNIHGIVYVSGSDQLIATDVGDAGNPDDGKLYVIDAAATASGSVMPTSTLSGSASQLGNPVDLAFDGESAYVAEKSNDKVLRFDDVLSASGDIDRTADASLDFVKPESVALVPMSTGSTEN